MEPRTKQNLLVTAFGIILFAVLMNLSPVLGFIGGIFTLILPIIAGSIVALFISVPVNGVQGVLEKQFEKRKKRISGKKSYNSQFYCYIDHDYRSFCSSIDFIDPGIDPLVNQLV